MTCWSRVLVTCACDVGAGSTTVAPVVSSSKSAVCDQVAATCSQRLAQDSSGGAANTPICQ